MATKEGPSQKNGNTFAKQKGKPQNVSIAVQFDSLQIYAPWGNFMCNCEKKVTGVRGIAAKIPGLDKPGLILLTARPGMSKTTLALNLVQTVAEKRTVAVL